MSSTTPPAGVPAEGLQIRLSQRAPFPLSAEVSCGRGELVALVGPSGSGKSTLLRAVAGIQHVEQGRVSCGGEVWFDSAAGIARPPQQRSVGLVFQHYALFPHLTALQNVMAGLGHVPRQERSDRAKEWLARVHLTGLEDRRPDQLSGGQQQRVAVARALARAPQVLLLDEPFSAVDKATRSRLQRELAGLRASLDIPILMVTHDLDEARALADRLTLLHRGETLQSGPPQELMARPRDPAVARLVDLTNIFQGWIVAHEPERDRTLLAWRDYLIEAPHSPAFAPGQRVAWVIPPSAVLLHRPHRPSSGDKENPVSGVIAEQVVLGDTVKAIMHVDGQPDQRLAISVARHSAQRIGLAPGGEFAASLLREAIHLMPGEDPASPVSPA